MKILAISALALLFAAPMARAQSTVQVPSTLPVPASTVQVPASTVSGTVPLVIPPGCGLNPATSTSPASVTCGVAPPNSGFPPPIPVRTKVAPGSGGTDDKAIYAAAAKGPIEITPGQYKMNSSSLPSNADVWCDDGAVLSDVQGYGPYDAMFALDGVSNIKFVGSRNKGTACLLTLPNSYKKNAASNDQNVNQYNNAFWMERTNNILLDGIQVVQSGGDSFYTGSQANGTHIAYVYSNDPIRNGCSVTDQTTNTHIEFSTFTGAHNKPAGIMDGCDIEPNGSGQGQPNPGQFIKSLLMNDNDFTGNAQTGLCTCFWFLSSQTPIDVTLLRNKGTFDRSNWPSPMNGAVVEMGNSWNILTGRIQARKTSGQTHKLN